MKKVLIVDDAVFMRLKLKEILEKNNLEIVGEASNGKEAIVKAYELKPDVITMDITMPQMDGIAAAKEIIKANPDQKICMVSAVGQEQYIREAILSGAKNFIVKPFKDETVIQTIQKILQA